MGAALADDLSSTARVRRETSGRPVVKLTGNICVSELRKINMTLMRRVALISLLALALLVPRQPAPAATGDDPVVKLDAFITKALKEYQVPGAAIAVVQNGKAVLLKGYGVRDVTKQGAVDENTIFQLASVTKTLTGAAAATVVDEGKLDWDKPIFNYLPEFVGYDPYMTRWLTEARFACTAHWVARVFRRPTRQFWLRPC